MCLLTVHIVLTSILRTKIHKHIRHLLNHVFTDLESGMLPQFLTKGVGVRTYICSINQVVQWNPNLLSDHVFTDGPYSSQNGRKQTKKHY